MARKPTALFRARIHGYTPIALLRATALRHEWFEQRTLRMTASNAYKLKGHRFNVEKVMTDLLNPKITQTVALKEYKQLHDP
ncbi:hypothetical protein PV326_003351 [Microctonus aethiopoides]|nr:hypothetical protein PV326_003351 [Microctonus aethiopoides]